MKTILITLLFAAFFSSNTFSQVRLNSEAQDIPEYLAAEAVNFTPEIGTVEAKVKFPADVNPLTCDPAKTPHGLAANPVEGGMLLSWDKLPLNVGCQVRSRIVGGTGSSNTGVMLGIEVESLYIPTTAFQGEHFYEWQVRCACATIPNLIVTAYSQSDTFKHSVYGGREASTIEELNVTDFVLAPNPVTERVLLSGLQGEQGIIKVFDNSGKQLLARAFTGNSMEIDLSNLPSGVYSVVNESEGHRSAKKLLISH